MVGRGREQVLRLARTLRTRQRTQRLGSPGLLARGLGKAGNRQFPFEESVGGLSATDVHDAGRRHRGGEPVECVAGIGSIRAAEEMEGDKSTFSGTFYYFCRVLEGYSRYIVHWDLRESMTEADVEIILQAVREKYPEARPRIISDNGPQFIARDFKEFIRISGMTHVRTSPYYPQSKAYASYCTSCE